MLFACTLFPQHLLPIQIVISFSIRFFRRTPRPLHIALFVRAPNIKKWVLLSAVRMFWFRAIVAARAHASGIFMKSSHIRFSTRIFAYIWASQNMIWPDSHNRPSQSPFLTCSVSSKWVDYFQLNWCSATLRWRMLQMARQCEHSQSSLGNRINVRKLILRPVYVRVSSVHTYARPIQPARRQFNRSINSKMPFRISQRTIRPINRRYIGTRATSQCFTIKYTLCINVWAQKNRNDVFVCVKERERGRVNKWVRRKREKKAHLLCDDLCNWCVELNGIVHATIKHHLFRPF